MLCAINWWLLTNDSWILQPRTSWLSWLVFWHLTYNIYIPYACWWQIPFSWSKCPSLLQTLMHDQTWNDWQPHFETDVSLSCCKYGTKKRLLHSHEESNSRPWILPSNANYWVIGPLWWVIAATDHFRWNEFRWCESSILTGSILFKG